MRSDSPNPLSPLPPRAPALVAVAATSLRVGGWEKTKLRARGGTHDGAPTALYAADGGRQQPGAGL
eukprot:scaffold14349_cov101-Isochrysis_galbana.AAC.4